MPAIQKIARFITDPFFAKILFVVFPFFAEIPLLFQIFNPLLKFVLLWAAVILIKDLVTKRTFLDMRYFSLALLFLVSYAITIIVNYKISLSMNLISYLYMGASFFVLFPVSKEKSTEDRIKEISCLNYILSGLTLIAAVIGIVMFLLQFGKYILVNETSFPVGFITNSNRLAGIYRNQIYPTPAIGMLCAIIQLVINRKKTFRYKPLHNVFLISTVFFNFWHICLANPRGVFISLMITGAGAAFFIVNNHLWKKNDENSFRKKAQRIFLALLCAGIAGCSVYGAIIATRKVSSYLPHLFVSQADPGIDTEDPGIVDLERHDGTDAHGTLTGRQYLWSFAIQEFLEHPLFGNSSYAFSDQKLIPGSNETFQHFHNIIFHMLCAAGLCGFVPFIAILLLAVYHALRFFLIHKNHDYYMEYFTIALLLLMLFIVNMGDTTILFLTKQSGFVFWIYLGYLISFTSPKKPFFLDRPLLWVQKKISQKALNR